MNAIYIRKAEEGNVMASARTNNVARNAWFAFIAQVINIVLSFLSRTVFIRLLGAEYLGVNGLFTNILTMLSFAELGIGNAIIYNLYKPLAENDQEKVKSLMALYEKAYKTIGCAIGLLGLLVMPFMGYIVKARPILMRTLTSSTYCFWPTPYYHISLFIRSQLSLLIRKIILCLIIIKRFTCYKSYFKQYFLS